MTRLQRAIYGLDESEGDPLALPAYRNTETGLVVELVRAVKVRKSYRAFCRVVDPGTSSYRKGELAMVNVYGDGWERQKGLAGC